MINTGFNRAFSTISVGANKMTYEFIEWITIRRRSLAVLATTYCLIAIAACSSAQGGKEIQRLKSPDGQVEAVLVSKNTGATVATPIEVYIVAVGQHWKKQSPVLRGDKFDELQMSWPRAQFLEVRYQRGRIFAYANFWNSEQVQNFKYSVEVRLAPQSTPSLPN